MIIPVTSRLNSVQVISYNEIRMAKNGPGMCALDPANETTSSSSVKDCSISCARDATCKGINIKNSSTCDVYTYQPKVTAVVLGCTFYKVDIISNSFLAHSKNELIQWRGVRRLSVCLSVCPSVNFCANRFYSHINGRNATKLAHDGLQVSLHPGCTQGQGQRSRDTRTFLDSWNELLRH